MNSINLCNTADTPFSGWLRTTSDRLPLIPANRALRWPDGTIGVPGRAITQDGVRIIDVRVGRLAKNSMRQLPIDRASMIDWQIGALPADPLDYFGLPYIDGHLMQVADVRVDGAAYTARLIGRGGPYGALLVSLWCRWYPDRAGLLCSGRVTCSGAGVAAVPAGTLTFQWVRQTATIEHPAMADGQSETFASLRGAHAVGADPWPSMEPGGYEEPLLPHPQQHYLTTPAGEIPLGIAANSGVTGAQEDQVFVARDTAHPVAAAVRARAALRHAYRPCHHLERSGALVVPGSPSHANLILWDGRRHWVSPDPLYTSAQITPEQAGGWWGPDVEHWLLNSLAVAWRQTGDPVHQDELRTQAAVYLGQWTVQRGWSTSQPYAARARGWEGHGAALLHDNLEDRDLAQSVQVRWLARWGTILRASCEAAEWDVRTDDPRLGPGRWWMPWQESVAVYGIYRAGLRFGAADACRMAAAQAGRIVDEAWREVGGRWLSAPVLPCDAGDSTPDATNAHSWACHDAGLQPADRFTDGAFDGFDETFNGFGMPLAVAVCLLADPTHAKARAIWDYLQEHHSDSTWLPPEVR